MATPSEERLSADLSLRLLLSMQDWISSRREDIDWESRTSVRRETQIDFQLPADERSVAEEAGVLRMPLTLIRKDYDFGPLVVRDEHGDRLPTLSTVESTDYAGAMLLAAAARDEVEVDEDLSALIMTVAGPNRSAAAAALPKLERLLEEQAGRNALLARLADWFSYTFPLIVELESFPRGRRSLVFEAFLPARTSHTGLRTIPSLLGWTASTMRIDLPYLGAARTSEANLHAPEGASISAAQLRILRDTPEGPEVTLDGFAGPQRTPAVRVGFNRAQRFSNGVLLVDLVPNRTYTGGVLLTALFVAAILTIGRARLGTVATEVDAAATVLLAGPTLFSALVARPGRGSAAAHFVTAARGVLVLSGLLAFVAAGSLVAVDSVACLRDIWLPLVVLSWLSSTVLLFSVISPGVILRMRQIRRALGAAGGRAMALRG